MGREVLEKIKNMSLSKIKEDLVAGVYGDNDSFADYRLVKLYIDEKELEENKNISKESLGISRKNAEATENLVKVTRYLVFVTGGLVLVGFLPYIVKLFKFIFKNE